MSSRYGDRDYDRGRQDYGRRSESDYDRSYGDRSENRFRFGRDESERERERYSGESRWRGQSGGGGSWSQERPEGEYRSGRGGYRPGSENDLDYSNEGESRYGSFVRGYDTGSYDDTASGSSQRYNYPTGFRSGQSYGDRSRGSDYDYGRSRYGQEGQGWGEQRGGRGEQRGGRGEERNRWGQERDWGRERGGYGEERGWWDRASDEVASWFGDEEAERRRHMDEQRQRYRGKGPKGYRRSDERIKEDVNDRLSEGYLDASEIEVSVQNGEVTLTGTVNSRSDKRRAEDIAEYISGVTHVENRLRVKQSDIDRYPSMTGTSGTTGATGTGITGTTGTTGATGTGTTGTTGTTGSQGTSDTTTGTGTGTARGRTAGT